MHISTRHLPTVGAALALALGGAGSVALAHDRDHHGDHHRGHTARYTAWDKQWLQTSIEGDLFEIEGGKIAQQRGSSQAVRAYGARLVQDHTKSLEDATKVAHRLGIEVPKAPTPSQQWELKIIASLPSSAFDHEYADLEAKDHQQDISESEDEVSDGCNRRVRHLAKSDLPVLRQHLAIAEQLGGRQGEDPTG
jgi:putative membrane protein